MSPSPRVVFFGGKPSSARCLKYAAEAQGDEKAEIVGVVCREKGHRGWWSAPGVPEMRETAEALGLPVCGEEDVPALEADMGFSVLHYKIIKPPAIESFRLGILNFHPAPLPDFRGCNSASFALMQGRTAFGAALHFIDPGVDTGDIVDVSRFEVPRDWTSRDLTLATESRLEEMFKAWYGKALRGHLPRKAQKEAAEEQGVKPEYHSRQALSGLREVDLAWDSEKLWNHVRAFDFPPFEPAYAKVNGQKVFLRTHPGAPPGQEGGD